MPAGRNPARPGSYDPYPPYAALSAPLGRVQLGRIQQRQPALVQLDRTPCHTKCRAGFRPAASGGSPSDRGHDGPSYPCRATAKAVQSPGDVQAPARCGPHAHTGAPGPTVDTVRSQLCAVYDGCAALARGCLYHWSLYHWSTHPNLPGRAPAPCSWVPGRCLPLQVDSLYRLH